MAEVLIAETCPVCRGRKYVKKGTKLVCCPIPKKATPKAKKASDRVTTE